MSDTTTDTKTYVNGSRREWRQKHYRYILVPHRADCPTGRWMRQRVPADEPHAPLPRCCK